ncbi:hypothetical protein RHMOL_Rhmol06G0215700 [Rhododendron molle]|nr:hypothetical protein RHMOL_Rhmol06G0215700 [Rhododendron molle]
MDLSYEDGLAATCPRFLRLRILELQRHTATRYVYYLIDSKNAEIRVAAAISYDNATVKYIADTEFVKKYSSLYQLEDIFEWDVADDFKTWIESILAQKPKFIHPYHRSSKYLTMDEDIPIIHYVIMTACPPISYRATRHAFRSAILIQSDILQKLVLPSPVHISDARNLSTDLNF